MKKTPALKLLEIVWANGAKDSWGRINHSMHAAVRLAIGSGLEFQRSDFAAIYKDFGGDYWMNASDEWVYTMAIAVLNDSCVAVYEAYRGRKPFRANSVTSGGFYLSDDFIHKHSPARNRQRVGVGLSFPLDGKMWTVTSFDDVNGIIRFARYEGEERKPKELRKATNDEFAKLFPAPKKLKTNPVTPQAL